jgi:hypothetical protein
MVQSVHHSLPPSGYVLFRMVSLDPSKTRDRDFVGPPLRLVQRGTQEIISYFILLNKDMSYIEQKR